MLSQNSPDLLLLHPMPDKDNCASSDILTIAEEELSRIVLDIHDGPVQYLFTALSLLTTIQDEIAEDPHQQALTPDIARVAMLLESSLYEIKFFLGAFRPPGFRRRSLASIIQGLVLQHEEATNTIVELCIEDVPEQVALPVKITIYRLIQEALANAYRHAGVDVFYVRLWGEDDWIWLEVKDDGKGFEAPDLDSPMQEGDAHIGLRGMYQRVRLVNGEFHLESQPGQGTRILAKVPAHV
jgi:signal transduction histidine kinase